MDELKMLNTKLVLRNDTHANWEAVKDTAKLLKGEVGLEFLESGEVKLKIGDGTKTWAELDYWGGDLKLKEGVMVLDGEELSLAGFAAAETGAQLVKGSDGKLSWVVPSTETVEGLQTTVESLKTDVTNIQTAVDAKADASVVEELAGKVETKAEASAVEELASVVSGKAESSVVEELAGQVATKAEASVVTALEEEVAKKANAEEVYTKTEVDFKLSSVYRYRGSVENYEALPTEGLTIGDVYNVAAVSPAHGIDAGDNVAWTGEGWDVLAGTIDLSGYYTKEEVNGELAKKVAVEEGKSLISNELIAKLEGMAADGEKNVIASVDEAQFAIDENRHLTLLDIDMSKVSGLIEALEGKVSVVEGERLMTEEEGEKLALIEEGAQVNIIEAIRINGEALAVSEKAVEIPVASAEAFGVVKSSSGENKVAVAADGTMSVEKVSVNSLAQDEGEFIVLNGGTASGFGV